MRLRWVLPLVLLVASCSTPPPPSSPSSTAPTAGEPRPASAPKRATIAVQGNVPALSSMALQGGPPTTNAFDALLHAGLTILDGDGRVRPVIAQDVPSLDNGLWKLNPDGSMEMLFYNPAPHIVSNRLTGPAPPKSPSANTFWNAHEWDVR